MLATCWEPAALVALAVSSRSGDGNEAVSDVMNTRIEVHEDRHGGTECLVGRPDAYRKPSLRRLGAWNVFTRNNSFSEGENPAEGFFQFEVR